MNPLTQDKTRAPRNRTLTISEKDQERLRLRLLKLPDDKSELDIAKLLDRTIFGDAFEVLPMIPADSVDLVIADPPYNLSKSYNGTPFARRSDRDYLEWLAGWLPQIERVLKPGGSFYLCCDWRTSPLVYQAARERFTVLNRITWEREKGRGAQANWKNCSEDIWFFAKGTEHAFDAEAVKLRRKVIAPYTDALGKPKDWSESGDGAFRMTSPSNFWSDITVPFWSMPENTEHPTQKPEKLVAKLVLASSRPGEIVLDPFSGSGTTSVVSKKLGRRYVGIEREERYACLIERRLEIAEKDPSIQGYAEGVFWERNSQPRSKRAN